MKSPDNKGFHCWVTNITKRDVGIGDLGVFVRSRSTIDLLDCNHSYLSVEKVEKSIKDGSLRRRLDQKKIMIRQSAPQEENPIRRVVSMSDVSFPNKHRSTVQVREQKFAELEINDTLEDQEKFASEMAESALIDHTAAILLSKEEEKTNEMLDGSEEEKKDKISSSK